MSNAIYDNFITSRHLKVRVLAIRAWKRRFWLIEDIAVCLAWACFIAMTIGYICVTETLYLVSDVGNNQRPPYQGFEEDAVLILKVFFPNTLLLWTTLWLVKFALLLQCRRLIDRRPRYITIWWIIVAVTSIFYVGCIVSQFTSCRSLHAWFSYGWEQR
ncbi:MAG: hypothetical protein Q9176_001161 [Flavoplaca citrina]